MGVWVVALFQQAFVVGFRSAKRVGVQIWTPLDAMPNGLSTL